SGKLIFFAKLRQRCLLSARLFASLRVTIPMYFDFFNILFDPILANPVFDSDIFFPYNEARAFPDKRTHPALVPGTRKLRVQERG
ncbi:MAG TPA: hypothetical protein VF905_05990, partial [Nitrospirota bacterium]